jgi:hypothetical protein
MVSPIANPSMVAAKSGVSPRVSVPVLSVNVMVYCWATLPLNVTSLPAPMSIVPAPVMAPALTTVASYDAATPELPVIENSHARWRGDGAVGGECPDRSRGAGYGGPDVFCTSPPLAIVVLGVVSVTPSGYVPVRIAGSDGMIDPDGRRCGGRDRGLGAGSACFF